MAQYCVKKANNVMKPNVHRRALLFCTKFLLVCWLSVLTTWCAATTIAYVANADSQDISVFQLNEKNGHVKNIQTFAVGGMVMPMALLKKSQQNQKVLYAAIRSEPYKVVVLDIDNATGKLTLQGSAPLADSMANISIDRSGRYLLAASYGGNKISVNALDEGGAPKAPAHVFATGSHPHQITSDPTNTFLYVSLLGENRLDYFRFNAATATLQPITESAITLPEGSGPRHFVFSTSGDFLYLIDELNANLHVLKRDLTTGKTSLLEIHRLLPAESLLKPWAADIHLTPNGKFLYATERTGSSISGFKVNKKNGTLTPIGSWNTESQPRAFAISPDGRYLMAAGQKSNHISVYGIHTKTGELVALDRKPTGANPAWVEIISLTD